MSGDIEWRAVESGPHLGLVRSFIQWHAINGSEVTWGSDDLVRFSSVTVDEMEQLAQRVYDAGKKAAVHWISVDTPPPVGERVLTIRRDVFGDEPFMQEYRQGDESDWHYWEEYTPTHWMRLPPVSSNDSTPGETR